MSTKIIRATCSHINLCMILSSLSIIVQLVESRKDLAIPLFNRNQDQNDSKSVERLKLSANGKFHNITIHHTNSTQPNNKFPPQFAYLLDKPSQDPFNTELFPNSRMGLDIKEIVLTNLNVNTPKPVVIPNHEDYSRENDGFEFSSRYLLDDKSAIGRLQISPPISS